VAAAGAALLVLVGCGAGGADSGDTAATPAASSDAAVSVRPYVRGLESPVHVAAPRGERGRIYVVEQPGRIVVVENGTVRDQPFLDIRPLVRSGGEQGLLSVAFHPGYASNRRFYVNYTDRNGDTNVVEYRSNGTTAIPGTARRLLFVHQPYANHNGGQLAFGPDRRLYIAFGDGGGAGDPEGNGQSLDSLLGKILRIDPRPEGGRPYRVPSDNPFVGRAGARPEIWAYGLRNPWRFSFDPATGDLWIGDVGQNRWEEIDHQPAGASGRNYGWDRREGRHEFEGDRPDGAVDPVIEYGREGGACTVIGGGVYRGARIPGLRGAYLYGDFCAGWVRAARVSGDRVAEQRDLGLQVPNLTSFGVDPDGEPYAMSLSGPVYRLAAG
jgi:glucose/arabinose dehydrogenase